MAACLLVVLAAGPSIDAIVCQDDAAFETALLTRGDVAKAAPAPASAPHGGDTGDICPHGHSHHFDFYVADEPVRRIRAASLEVPLGRPAHRFPPSLPAAAPERPPRV